MIRTFTSALAGLVLALVLAPATVAQPAVPAAPEKLVRATAAPLHAGAGSKVEAVVTLAIEKGWHINANPPSPDYMIPTTVELSAPRGVSVGRPSYPGPKPLKVGFDEAPLFVYDGAVTVKVPLTVSRLAPGGTHTLSGKVTFQGCNDELCLAPVSTPFTLALTIAGADIPGRDPVPEGEAGAIEDGGAATGEPEASHPAGDPTGAVPDSSADAGALTTHPPSGASGGALLDNPIARKLSSGSWTAFLTLFLIGLALNLTPCVYPMLGVTVSIFGARKSERPLQALGYAVIYVMGMALMYSALGLVAAFTGGLFGGLMQNPVVLIAIGGLLLALALSMFGLFELQLPPALTMRLGGQTATGAAGVFLSGLVVGIFAAPCIGPPIVALLALVGAKADPWFGFSSFFTLAMGLGAPYLVLGTFSNLLQQMPRSGDWMVWVKKVFGVVLVALGLFYVLLAVGPGLTMWVVPAALIAGGAFLGFFEKSGDKRTGFRWLKRLAGGAAAVAGAVMVVTTPSESLAFEDFSPAALEAALASNTPVMMDFTANWCAPCHELERFTFTDGDVRRAAKSFRTFRVDLTRYNSPESERFRREYEITGVPTVLFLTPGGEELRKARVEGFLPPKPFLDRMRMASAAFETADNAE
jgi:thiol:disulfide interchange protein DsbD